MERLVYVSESGIKDADVDAVVAKIVAEAQKRNAHLGLTGALIFTGTHFAQVLEGCDIAIDELMLSLYKDTRHGAIAIIDRSPISVRQFPHWAMAYNGPSLFVSRHINRLFHATSVREQKRAATWLIDLAREFLKP